MRSTPCPPTDPDDAHAAEATALRVLRGAGQSSLSLQRKLQRRGYTAEAAAEAVRRCAAAGYIDDGALAASVAARHRRTGHGRAWIAADLRARGIDDVLIGEAIADETDTEEATAMALAGQLWTRAATPEGHDPRARMRIAGQLQRRGFSPSTIARVTRALS